MGFSGQYCYFKDAHFHHGARGNSYVAFIAKGDWLTKSKHISHNITSVGHDTNTYNFSVVCVMKLSIRYWRKQAIFAEENKV